MNLANQKNFDNRVFITILNTITQEVFSPSEFRGDTSAYDCTGRLLKAKATSPDREPCPDSPPTAGSQPIFVLRGITEFLEDGGGECGCC